MFSVEGNCTGKGVNVPIFIAFVLFLEPSYRED